jgi:hypothetical protein
VLSDRVDPIPVFSSNWRKLDNSGISRTVRPMVLASAGFAACRTGAKIEREAMRVRENLLKSFMERMRKKIIKWSVEK